MNLRPAAFNSPADAAKAFLAAPDLQARLDLLRPVAEAYLRAHQYDDLIRLITASPTDPNASWQHAFLLANLHLMLGDSEGTSRLLAGLPNDATKNPAVFDFWLAHPEFRQGSPSEVITSLAALATTPESRLDLVRAYLANLDPGKAMQVIAAHPDDLLDNEIAWSDLTPRFFNENLLPAIIPYISKKVSDSPGDWQSRLMLANYQLLEGDETDATANFQWLCNQKDTAVSYPAQSADDGKTLAQRVSAMREIFYSEPLWYLRQPRPGDPFRAVRTMDSARDYALICLAALASEHGHGQDFLNSLARQYNGDQARWLAGLMMFGSRALVVRSLEAYLDQGPASAAVNSLAYHWLKETPSPGGVDTLMGTMGNLLGQFSKLNEAPAAQPSLDPTPAELHGALNPGANKTPDQQNALLKSIESEPDAAAVNYVSSQLIERAVRPKDRDFGDQAGALLLAKCFAAEDQYLATARTLAPGPNWQYFIPPMPRRFAPHLPPAPSPPPNLAPADLQSARIFLAQCTPFAWGSDPLTLPSALNAGSLSKALDNLTSNRASRYNVDAQIANAWILGLSGTDPDRPIKILQDVTAKSPSYVARILLAAFLTEHGRYQESLAAFDGIKPIPGYFSLFLQAGRSQIEQLANPGHPSPPQSHPGAIAPKLSVSDHEEFPWNIYELYNRYHQLVSKTPLDPASKDQILEIFTESLLCYPTVHNYFPRPEISDLKKIGLLSDEIARIEDRAGQSPKNPDIQLALGDLYSLTGTAEAMAAYRRAFALAPERADAAEKLTGTNYSPEERMTAYCTLLKHDPIATLSAHGEMIPVFREAGELPRLASALHDACANLQLASGWVSPDLTAPIQQLRDAGLTSAAIDVLTAQSKAPGSGMNGYNTEPAKALIKLLTDTGSTAAIAPVVDRILFPKEDIHGLDIYSGIDLDIFHSCTDFVSAVKTPDGLAALKNHARQIMADHPGSSRAPMVLLAMEIENWDPDLQRDLQPCLAALKSSFDGVNTQDLVTLAGIASEHPDGRNATAGLLDQALIGRAPGDLRLLEVQASLALNLGDIDLARTALGQIVAEAKIQHEFTGEAEWQANIVMLARAGMDAETDAMIQKFFVPGHESSSSALGYMEACIQEGHPNFALKMAPCFLGLLTADIAASPQSYPRIFPGNFARQIVDVFVTLGVPDEARTALDKLMTDAQAFELSDLVNKIAADEELLRETEGGTPAAPMAFVASGTGDEVDCWWDLNAFAEPGTSAPRLYFGATGGDSGKPEGIGTFGWDLKSQAGRYSFQILGGPAPDQLQPIAKISGATSRGSWRGTPPAQAQPIAFTQVLLTGTDGQTIRGPVLPAMIGQELLHDPGMEGPLKSRQSTADWTFDGGLITPITGPIPGSPAISYVYRKATGSFEIRGARIPIKPGEAFVQSGWMRPGETLWGIRFLDAAGNQINDSFTESPSADASGWVYVAQRLEPAPDLSSTQQGSRELDLPPPRTHALNGFIPPDAAFIEPILQAHFGAISPEPKGPYRWAGLSLLSVAPVTPDQLYASQNAAPPIQQMPKEMPTPIPAAAKRWLVDPAPFYAIDGEGISKIAVSPESDVVVAGCDSGKIVFIDYPSGKKLAAIQAHDSSVIEIATLPSRGGAYSIDTEGNLTLDTINPPDSNIIACTAHRPFAAMITPDRKMAIYVAGGWPPNGRIEAVALPDGKKIKVIPDLGGVLRASLSPDGTKLLMIQNAPPQGWVTETWDLPSFNRLPDTSLAWDSMHGLIEVLREHATARAGLFAADVTRGRYVEFTPYSGFKIYSTKDDKPLHGLTYSGTPAAAVVVPRDGSILMGTTDGKIVRYTPSD